MNKHKSNCDVIRDLKQKGYRVYVKHTRFYDIDYVDYDRQTFTYAPCPNPRGGETTVHVYLPYPDEPETFPGEYMAGGTARCNPDDNFCKKRGLQIALGRVVSKLESSSFAFLFRHVFLKETQEKDEVGGQV